MASSTQNVCRVSARTSSDTPTSGINQRSSFCFTKLKHTGSIPSESKPHFSNYRTHKKVKSFIEWLLLGCSKIGEKSVPSLHLCRYITQMVYATIPLAVRSKPMPHHRVDLAERLHDIADEIWEERNWIPRDRALWKDLNNIAVELHRIAAEAGQEILLRPLGTAPPIEDVMHVVRARSQQRN